MKICWDNLEGMYLTIHGNFRKNNKIYYLKECKGCGDQCFSVKRHENCYCSRVCKLKYDSPSKRGKEHHWWTGGNSTSYCSNWFFVRKESKKEDKYTCQNPQCNRKYKRLDSHHIDYNKQNCHPDNIITLCVSCNAQANYNREWWEAYYTEIKRRTKL